LSHRTDNEAHAPQIGELSSSLLYARRAFLA
jgi:hypothetical protein